MLTALLQKIQEDHFAALRGTAVAGRIPLREGLLNDVLTAVRQERDLPTKRLEIRLNASNQFTLFLQPQVGFFHPNVKLDFEVIPEVDLQGESLFTLRSLGFLGGPTAQLVRTVLLRALKLPDHCVRVHGNAIQIAIREALVARNAGDIADFLRSLQITTRSGVLYILFSITI